MISSFGALVKESEEELLETLVEKIKGYNKNEKIGISGGQKRAILTLLPPDSRKWIFDEVEGDFPFQSLKRKRSGVCDVYELDYLLYNSFPLTPSLSRRGRGD